MVTIFLFDNSCGQGCRGQAVRSLDCFLSMVQEVYLVFIRKQRIST